MRSFMSKDSFFKKMKKKPELQRVFNNISNYTEADINALTGSHFPQWIKEQLIERTKRGGKTSEDVSKQIADMMNSAAGAQLSVEEFEDTSIIPISTSNRKITAADFALPQIPNGTILDTTTQGNHAETPGFEEHMRTVRERMRNNTR